MTFNQIGYNFCCIIVFNFASPFSHLILVFLEFIISHLNLFLVGTPFLIYFEKPSNNDDEHLRHKWWAIPKYP
jgi:hypothetical protein